MPVPVRRYVEINSGMIPGSVTPNYPPEGVVINDVGGFVLNASGGFIIADEEDAEDA